MFKNYLGVVLCLSVCFAGTWSSLLNALQPPIDILTGLQYTAYQKGPTCQPTTGIKYPTTTDELVAIVQSGQKVKAFGHRHSVTDIICTNGIPVDMGAFKSFSYDPNTQRVTLGAGIQLYDATRQLKAFGRALRTTPAWGNITIGGAIGTGAHGSSLKYTSSISEQVVELGIVDGLGNLRTISSEEDLASFRVHLGLLGIIVNVTLATHPMYKVTALNTIVNDDILLNGQLVDMVRNSDQTTVYWFPAISSLLIANWTMVDASTNGTAWTSDHVPPTSEVYNTYAVPTLEIIQTMNNTAGLHVFEVYTMASMYTTVPDFQPIYTYDGITASNPATGDYDRMFAPVCGNTGFLQCPWFHGSTNKMTFLDQELALGVSDLASFAADLKNIVSQSPVAFPFDGILLRFSAASTTHLSTAYGKDVCHFEFYMMKRKDPYNDPSLGLAAYQAIMQTLSDKYHARSHWGKSGLLYTSTPKLNANLDQGARASFIATMNKYDPNQVFMNDFGRRILGTGSAMSGDPAETRCALLDTCICSKNEDCANGQICGPFNATSYNYNVCKDPYVLNVPVNINAGAVNAYLANPSSLSQLMCTNTLLNGLASANLNSVMGCLPIGGGSGGIPIIGGLLG